MLLCVGLCCAALLWCLCIMSVFSVCSYPCGLVRVVFRRVLIHYTVCCVISSHSRSVLFLFVLNVYNCVSAAGPCRFPCLNGGQCVHSESCDCSLYQATGHRCQTGESLNKLRPLWGALLHWLWTWRLFPQFFFHIKTTCFYLMLPEFPPTASLLSLFRIWWILALKP